MGSDPKEDLRRYLQAVRDWMLWKLNRLSEYDVRRPLPPTGTNLLGLVKHLAGVELVYFGHTFDRPSSGPLPWHDDDAEPNADTWATPDEPRECVVWLYQRTWTRPTGRSALLPGTLSATCRDGRRRDEGRMGRAALRLSSHYLSREDPPDLGLHGARPAARWHGLCSDTGQEIVMTRRVSIDDAAAMLGATRDEVEKLVRDGTLSQDQEGIPLDELTQYMAEADAMAGPQFDTLTRE